MTTPWWMVVLLGMGIVFVGLGLLVYLCDLLRVVFARFNADKPAVQSASVPAQPSLAPSQPAVADRKKLLAIAAAAIAEAEGIDAPGFKIVSFERR